VPTVVDNTEMIIVSNEVRYTASIWDTAGKDEYKRIRQLSYPKTDLFIVLFSVVDQISLTKVKEKWYPELREYCPFVPILLVGTKSDLRRKGHLPQVSQQQVGDLVAELGLAGYVECSALEGTGLRKVLDVATRIMITQSNAMNKKSDCFIM
jgi:small GTP-binding protein